MSIAYISHHTARVCWTPLQSLHRKTMTGRTALSSTSTSSVMSVCCVLTLPIFWAVKCRILSLCEMSYDNGRPYSGRRRQGPLFVFYNIGQYARPAWGSRTPFYMSGVVAGRTAQSARDTHGLTSDWCYTRRDFHTSFCHLLPALTCFASLFPP